MSQYGGMHDEMQFFILDLTFYISVTTDIEQTDLRSLTLFPIIQQV